MGINIINITKNNNTQTNTPVDTAERYIQTAEDLCRNNNHAAAIEIYLNSILINGKNPNSYIGLANAYKSLKKYSKAISTLQKAEKIIPDNALIQKELAMCNIIDGNINNGMKHLISSIKLAPDNCDIQLQLALVHEMIGEDDMALMIYQRIIEKNPSYLRAYIQKATLYMHLEDYVNSAKAFKQVLKIKKDYFRAYLALGICYDKLNISQSAKRYYKKYLQYNKFTQNYNEIMQRINNLSKKSKGTVKLTVI